MYRLAPGFIFGILLNEYNKYKLNKYLEYNERMFKIRYLLHHMQKQTLIP